MSTITLSNNAFQNCTSLVTFTFADNVGSLGSEVFSGCTSLESVYFNDIIKSIPDGTFNNCVNLSTIQIYKSMSVIGFSAFTGCLKLQAFASEPPYAGTLITNALPGDYVYNFFFPPGTNGFYLNYEGPICFGEDTKILCLDPNTLQDTYISIKTLKSGDIVKSYLHGYRKVMAIGKGTMINNPSLYYSCMYRMSKEKNPELIEDLFVTGGHSILVDDLGEFAEVNKQYLDGTNPKIDNKFLQVAAGSPLFEKVNSEKSCEYYHFVLANDGDLDRRFGVWANGVLTETPSMNQFLSSNLKPF
jgi:hypothetical protein